MTLHEDGQTFNPQDLDGSLAALISEGEPRSEMLDPIILGLENNDHYAIALVRHALDILEEVEDTTVIAEEQVERYSHAKIFFQKLLRQHVMTIQDENLRTKTFSHVGKEALGAIEKILSGIYPRPDVTADDQ